MSFLSGIFNNTTSNVPVKDSVSSVNNSSQGLQNASIKLDPGTQVTGTIVGVNKDTVSVDVGGTVINAKLEGNVSLTQGDIVTFDVKGSSDSQITLNPLFTNTANISTAIKALTQANLPISDNSISMTDSMITGNMRIDEASLTKTYRQTMAFPDASPATIVEMNKFGLEINSANIESFEAFKNYENQLTEGMKDIVRTMPEVFKELALNEDNQSFVAFAKEVIDIFNADENYSQDISSEAKIMDGQAEVNVNVTSSDQKPLENNSNQVQLQETKGEAVFETLKADDSSKTVLSQPVLSQPESDKLVDEKTHQTDRTVNLSQTDKVLDIVDNDNKAVISSEQRGLEDNWQKLSTFEKSNMLDVLKQAGMDDQAAKNLLSENATAKDFLNAVKTVLDNGKITDDLKNIISSDKFSEIIKSRMQEQMLLTPTDVNSKDTVESLMRRLNEQTKHLTESLNNLSLTNTSMADSLSNMNSNLDFMNQMNNIYQYVQLPLKMNGGEATGDLFVYTDKKSLARKDGNVSALLHLDMNNLGPLDVYASITPGNNVFTKFYVADDDILDFIESNIHILNERLENRGYAMKCETVKRDDNSKIDPVSTVMSSLPGQSSAGSDVARKVLKYSFDIRA